MAANDPKQPLADKPKLDTQMLTKQEAREKIVQELSCVLVSDDDLVIQDDETQEYDWGWVFFYQSKNYLETQDYRFMLLGNAPYIVNRQSGEVVSTGTAYGIDHYVKDYEASLEAENNG